MPVASNGNPPAKKLEGDNGEARSTAEGLRYLRWASEKLFQSVARSAVDQWLPWVRVAKRHVLGCGALLQSGVRPVRMCPPFPTSSTMAAMVFPTLNVIKRQSTGSLRGSPQPRSTAKMALSLLPLTLSMFGSCHRERASCTANHRRTLRSFSLISLACNSDEPSSATRPSLRGHHRCLPAQTTN